MILKLFTLSAPACGGTRQWAAPDGHRTRLPCLVNFPKTNRQSFLSLVPGVQAHGAGMADAKASIMVGRKFGD